MSITEKLSEVQQNLRCPKNQFNTFGKYNYRNCEDILIGLKKVLNNSTVTITDDIQQIGERYYVKATATFSDGSESIITTAFAREPVQKKGMDESQITGAASSYARKYALCGLFALDDNKDADSRDNRNAHEEKAYTATQKAIFDKAINDTDALSLWALKEVSGEEAYMALFSSFEPGTVTRNKDICRKLEADGAKEWAVHVDNFQGMIESEDAMGLAEEVEGLENHEKKYLALRLGDEKTKQLKGLIAGVPANEPDWRASIKLGQ